jgi:phosphotransferase family enzyme
MCADKMHDDEMNINAALVRRLVAAPFPQWTNLPVKPVELDGITLHSGSVKIGACGCRVLNSTRCRATLEGEIDTDAGGAVWEAALATIWHGSPVWFHGDIAWGNLLVEDGRLSTVIDEVPADHKHAP